MNFQNVIVFFIVAAACFYIGGIVWKKVKSFSTKFASCASGCGCGDTKSAAKNSLSNVQSPQKTL
jgi:hypothetical protein